MRLRDFALAACLCSCQFWGTSLAQQAAVTPGVPPPPEPHPAAPAAPTAYNVEILIFRANSTLGSPENWSAEAAQAPAVPLAADGENGAPAPDSVAGVAPGTRFVRALTPAEFQLTDLETRIKSSGTYVAVAHIGWAQTASPWGSHDSMSLQQLGLNNPLLAGTVTLQRGEFLHLGFALTMTIANPPAGLDAAPQTTFVLSENQRVKFYERNYYDAPAFGVIALVTPAQGARRAGR
jgi:hypothetical protein